MNWNWDAIMVAAAFLGGSGVAGISARYVLTETRKSIGDLKLEIVKDREVFIEKLNGKYVNRELCDEKHRHYSRETVD